MTHPYPSDTNRYSHLTKFSWLGLAALLLTGCATLPGQDSIQSADGLSGNDQSVKLSSVRQNPDAFSQSEVKWGGEVQKVENRDNKTFIEVVERPLNRSGRPQLGSLSRGRFIAVVPDFLEPTDYRVGRAITVSGNISGVQQGTIGATEYEYPEVAVVDHQLWLPANTARARRGSYSSPYRGSFSIGLGLGSHKSLGFGYRHRGFRSSRGYYSRFGHNRYRGFNRGFKRGFKRHGFRTRSRH